MYFATWKVNVVVCCSHQCLHIVSSFLYDINPLNFVAKFRPEWFAKGNSLQPPTNNKKICWYFKWSLYLLKKTICLKHEHNWKTTVSAKFNNGKLAESLFAQQTKYKLWPLTVMASIYYPRDIQVQVMHAGCMHREPLNSSKSSFISTLQWKVIRVQ